MLARVEELLQQPGAPNLYWALTTLPHPLVNVRHSMRYELGTLYRSFPQLRDLEEKKLTAEQVDRLVEEFTETLGKMETWGKAGGVEVPAWQGKLALAAMAAKTYPEAKAYLLSQGRAEAEVKAMPTLQVVLAFYLGQYNQVRDDILKWLSVPPWQAQAALERIDKEIRAAASSNLWIKLLMPAFIKVYAAHVRMERQVAGLRCAEAVRLYAAAHDGKLPAKLADVTEGPLPIDPVTGKGLDAFYQAEGDKAVLEVPAPPGQPVHVGRRYEFTRSR
jgi:hypothetical protein